MAIVAGSATSQVNPDSVPLLEAWLDRSHPDWREAAPAPPAEGPLTRAEALAILGLEEGATEGEIRAAATAPMGIPPWEVAVTVFHGKDKVRELAWDTADAYEKLLKFFGGAAGAAGAVRAEALLAAAGAPPRSSGETRFTE